MVKKKYTISDVIKESIDLMIELQKREQIIQSIKLFIHYFSKDINIDDKEINSLYSLRGGISAEKMEKWIKELKEEGIKEGKEKGIKEGIELRTVAMVKRMLKANIQIEQIIEVSGLSPEEIEKIKDTIETQTKD